MCDFRKLNDMVLASLPFVEEWSRVQAHRDQLEVALAGVAALMLAVGSQYKLTAGGAVLLWRDTFWQPVIQRQEISHRPIGCHREHILALSSHGSCRYHKPRPIC
jgi:hypothetical protein